MNKDFDVIRAAIKIIEDSDFKPPKIMKEDEIIHEINEINKRISRVGRENNIIENSEGNVIGLHHNEVVRDYYDNFNELINKWYLKYSEKYIKELENERLKLYNELKIMI